MAARAEDAFHGAVRRTATRRETAQARARPPSSTMVFFGAKGGAGHDDGVGELRGGAGAADEAADDHRGPEAVSRRGGAVPRRASAHYAASTPSRTCTGWIKRLPAGAGGATQVRAGNAGRLRAVRSARRQRLPAPSKSSSACSAKTYDYILVDAGNAINSCTLAALYAADTIFFVTNPGRALDPQRAAAGGPRAPARRRRRAGAHSAEPRVRAAHDRAEADRDGAGLRDSPHVPQRLQDRVDGAQFGRAAGADEPFGDRPAQFDSFTRPIIAPGRDGRRARPRRSERCSACSASETHRGRNGDRPITPPARDPAPRDGRPAPRPRLARPRRCGRSTSS